MPTKLIGESIAFLKNVIGGFGGTKGGYCGGGTIEIYGGPLGGCHGGRVEEDAKILNGSG